MLTDREYKQILAALQGMKDIHKNANTDEYGTYLELNDVIHLLKAFTDTEEENS